MPNSNANMASNDTTKPKPKPRLSRSLPDPGLSPITPMPHQHIRSNLQPNLQEIIQRNIELQLPALIARCIADNFSPANLTSEYLPLSPGLKECMDEQTQSLKEIKQDISSIKESQTFQSEMYDEISAKQKSMEDNLSKCCKRIRELEDLVYELEEELFYTTDKVEEQERRSRLDNLEFHGLAPTPNEDTDKLVMEVGKMIHVDIKPSDISVTHRFPSQNSNIHKPLIAKFTNRKIRNKILKNRHLIRTARNTTSVSNLSKAFIVENLTDKNRNLFYQAKILKRQCGYAFLWTSSGRVLVKKNKETNTLSISNEDDLQKIR
uniref:uncharacterized protein LOC120343521 n=1 Tax=Styela clava TaxID=7725 RepID=UPI001939A1CB|nr:uncharacterized protein LOC120343521 [Styela clava]XP_039273877.1 uncharacterized protein LOC120347839 [Styela clava]